MSKIYEMIKKAEREREQTTRRDTATSVATRETTGDTERNFNSTEEEYRRLRASLVLSAGITELHTILITAPRHGEGTTRIALGLATALAAEQGARVLLVEGNLRSPSLARILHLPDSPGLADFLAGQANTDDLIQRVDWRNLSVVHAGTRPVPIDSEAIGTALARLQPQFDFVIVDTPPVNRYADASILAPKVDGVVLVVEADQTPVVDAETAKRNLDRVGARILGVVLNRQKMYMPAWLQAFF